MKKLFITISIFILGIPFYSVNAMEKTADILKKNVVTTGDGLYEDNTVDGRYVYKGGNPNNYIRLGDDLYRIISLEKDGTIKVIKQKDIGSMAWDEKNARYSVNDEDFCTSEYGCKVWGSNTTTLDTNGNKVTQMPWMVNGTLKNLPDKEATLNTYLNNDFYNGLSDDVKSLVVEKTWNVGPTAYTQTNLLESIKEESAYKWKGKVALMNVTDYVKSSTNNACTSVKDYAASHSGGNSSCYTNSNAHNYLYSNNYPWSVSPDAVPNANTVFSVGSGGDLISYGTNFNYGVYPTFYLSAKTTLNGEGTETNPYIVSKYVEDEVVKSDNADVVEVPSTSAQMSIIIASIGIIFISLAIIITKFLTKRKNN